MNDFSELLAQKTDTIVAQWVEAARQDQKIESNEQLPYLAIRNSLPRLLEAMATTLSESQGDDVQSIVHTSLEHGVLRAEQGYEPTEIAREYHLLRQIIFSVLETGLLQVSTAEVIRAFRLIDAMLDEAIAQCFKSYTEERLRELAQLQSQLTLNNQELTRLVRANQDNLAHLTHELKTPLTSIIGYADLFLRQQRRQPGTPDTSGSLGYVERVLGSSRQLLRLINDVLEISRYEAGKMRLQLTPTDVRSLIKSVVEVLEPLACAKELQMVVECSDAPDQVLTDAFRLQQIIINLLSNAIRYTETGSIRLKCQVLPKNQWLISVTDTGVGIAPEDQLHVFEPFFQASANHRPHPDSTGLGLAIVSQLVKILQGSIELVSQVGVGSTFTVILPLELQLTEAVAIESPG